MVTAVAEKPTTQGQHPLMLAGQLLSGRNAQVQVKLLGDGVVRPGGCPQVVDLLESDPSPSGGIDQDQPVAPLWIGLADGRGLVARSVLEAEELTVELGEAPSVGGVQDDRSEGRERVGHASGIVAQPSGSGGKEGS